MERRYFFKFFILFMVLITSCNQQLKYENIQIENGIYINSKTNAILNGTYLCEDENTVIELEFQNGIPINKWKETHSSELIHSGLYLNEPKVQESIKEITDAYRVDLNYWSEIDFYTMNIELIQPKKLSPPEQDEIIKLIKENLSPKYRFEGIRIHTITPDNKEIIVIK